MTEARCAFKSRQVEETKARTWSGATELRTMRPAVPTAPLQSNGLSPLILMDYYGSMTFNPGTTSKCRLLNVATSLPRASAVAATMTS